MAKPAFQASTPLDKLKQFASGIDSIIGALHDAISRKDRAAIEAEEADAAEKAALKALEEQQQEAMAARVEILEREVVAAAQHARDAALYAFDRQIVVLQDIGRNLFYKEGEYQRAFDELVKARAELGPEFTTVPLGPRLSAYQCGGMTQDGARFPSGGWQQFLAQRLSFLNKGNKITFDGGPR